MEGGISKEAKQMKGEKPEAGAVKMNVKSSSQNRDSSEVTLLSRMGLSE
jgi:hypothetical protein